MTQNLKIKDWTGQTRRRLTATQIVAALAKLGGWGLQGDGDQVAITKTFRFANYYQTMAFVNAIAMIAHQQDHHPDLSVHYDRCVVRLATHDVAGVSATDVDCAARIDALLAPA